LKKYLFIYFEVFKYLNIFLATHEMTITVKSITNVFIMLTTNIWWIVFKKVSYNSRKHD